MKKKTLLVLLIIPLIIGLISFVSVSILMNIVPIDIDGISWNYRSQEGFKISDQGYLLQASPIINDTSKPLANGNDLIWYVSQDQDVASIEEDQDGNFYLLANNEGQVEVTCSNEKRSVSKSFTAIVYEKGTIIINPKLPTSGFYSSNVKQDIGEYDYTDSNTSNQKKKASLQIDVEALGDSTSIDVLDISNNITYSSIDSTINFTSSGLASITFYDPNNVSIIGEYSFNIVANGVNIYTYSDLLRATNKSNLGEIAVLRTNFLSLDQMYEYTTVENEHGISQKIYSSTIKQGVDSRVNQLFGNFNFETQQFSFLSEVYTYESSYLTSYIDQYNQAFKDANVSKLRYVGLHVQQDFYGNGFKLSMHNLAYPRNGYNSKNYDSQGRIKPAEGDIFKGPLPYMAIGDMKDNNIISAYGLDNSGILVDKDNVCITDLQISNTDQLDNLYDYNYVGTVIDVEANNITIKNSIISNGKNVLRGFSSDNLLIDNCILNRAGEFLMLVGSNRYEKVDTTNRQVSYSYLGQTQTDSFDNAMKKASENSSSIDNKILSYLGVGDEVSTSIDNWVKFLESIQENIYDAKIASDDYDANITVRDSYFATSGMFSIAFETNFNGPYLYNGSPSFVSETFNELAYPPNNIGGTSYPVKLTLEGDTAFYDYKDINTIDMNSLIEENLSSFINGVVDDSNSEIKITIDDFFPVKPILKDLGKEYIYSVSQTDQDGSITKKDYINTKVIFYGGGNNQSILVNNTNDADKLYSSQINIDLVRSLSSGQYAQDFGDSTMNALVRALSKCVLMVTGSHPFRAYLNQKVASNTKPSDFDLTIDTNKLINNRK